MEQFRAAWVEKDFVKTAKAAEIAADWAAKEAPYIHPKLAAIEHTGRNGGPIELTVTSDDAAL